MSVQAPDRRLMSAADFVRPGAVFADIGTDHAYLPVFLLNTGRINHAVAADINRAPLESARRNVSEAGLDGKVDFYLTDGLSGLEGLGLTDIAVCGMGGELISRIIAAAPWTKNPSVRLILQPMTKAECLRGFLNENGYTVTGEALSEEDRIYQTICAGYTGKTDTYSPAELLFGKLNAARCDELFLKLASRELEVFGTRRAGRLSAGLDTSYEDGIIEFLIGKVNGNREK